MSFTRSWLVSLLLHCSLLVLLLAGGALAPRIELPPPSYQVDLISLAEQGGREGAIVPKDVSGSKPTTAPDAGPAKPAAEAKAPESNAVPIPEQIKVPDKPKEEKPKTEDKPKVEEKPKEEKPKEEKPKEEKPKEEKPKEEKPKEQKPPQQKPPKDPVADALAAAQKSSEKNTRPRAAGGDQDIADAISTLRNQETRDALSGGGEGTGEGAGYGGGVGIDATYTTVITAIIKKNWTFPGMADRSNLVAVVRVTLSALGEVTGANIEKSSGRADFDASVLAAVQRSNGQLPPPPNPSLQDLRLTFHEAE